VNRQRIAEYQAERALRRHVSSRKKESTTALLDRLVAQHGVSWRDLARVTKTTVSTLRKWRWEDGSSQQGHDNLAHLAGLLDTLERTYHMENVLSWMESYLPLGPGYLIRPMDLYLDGRTSTILSLAVSLRPFYRTLPRTLDKVWPEWRDNRSDFEVYTAGDGQLSIRPRISSDSE